MKKLTIILFASFTYSCSIPLSAQEFVVTDFNISGTKKIKSSFIKKITTIEIGTVIDSLAIAEDIKALKRLSSVAHADFQVIKNEEKDGYTVSYYVEDNFTFIPSINIYTTNDDEFAYRIGLYEFNLFGSNIIFGGFYQHDIYSSAGINFRAPFLFTRHLGLAVNYQNLTTQEPVFLNNGTAEYRYNNTSYEILGLYQINFNHRFEAGVSYFNEDYQYIKGVTSPDVPQLLNVGKMLWKGIYEYNNLNFNYQYVSGFRSIFNVQYVTSTDQTLPGFVIGWNDFLYYKRIGRKGNWASRLRMGLANNNESPFAPFAVDNNLTIRGVGNTIDRGTGVIVVNTEYRQTMYEKNWFVLQGNMFIDGGSWRNPGGDLGDFGDTQNFRIYPGIGLRFIHKRVLNAIFRLDCGFGITKDATQGIVFGVGQYF